MRRNFENLLFASAILVPGEETTAHVLACAFTVNALAQRLEPWVELNFTVTPKVRKTLRENIAKAAKVCNQIEIMVEIPGEGWFEFTLQCGCGSVLYGI